MTEPDPRAPGTTAGVSEEMIHTLVHQFYARVRCDQMLGPVFNATVTDWESHLAKLCDFWSSVTLMTGRYKGAPMRAHAMLPAVSGAHFDHWLALFQATAQATCPPQAAALFIARAERIAQSLEVGIGAHRGQIVSPRKRLMA
jgi:hemoglobin